MTTILLLAVTLLGEEPLVVTGDGESTTSRTLPPLRVESGGAYAFSWEQRVTGKGGAATAGSSCANLGAGCPRDGGWHPGKALLVMPCRGPFASAEDREGRARPSAASGCRPRLGSRPQRPAAPIASADETELVPPGVDRTFDECISFGQWMLDGQAEFRNAVVEPLTVKYAVFDGFELGHGERLENRAYSFFAPCGTAGWLKARTLHAFDCGYQGALWWFDREDAYVTYRHAVAGRRILKAKVYAGPSEWMGGEGEVTLEASADGKTWRRLGGVTPKTSAALEVPADLLPAAVLYVRLRGGKGVSVQVAHYAVEAELDGGEGCFTGATRFLDAAGKLHTEIAASPYYDDFGELLESGDDGIALWRTTADRKVPRRRPLPAVKGKGIAMRAAANETEAAQLVVCPKADLADVRVTADFPLPVEVLRVGYVKVTYPSDGFGIFGEVPDPLPPQDAEPFAVKAGENQPFWVRVKVPKGTPGGVYRGSLTVSATPGDCQRGRDGARPSRESKRSQIQFSLPLTVEVFGFELPDETACETAFGCSLEKVFPYYRPEWGSEAHRQLREDALGLLGEHRISPYLYSLVDGFSCRLDQSGKVVFDWTKWDLAVETALAKHRFNTFMIPLMGLGQCSMSSQTEPEFFGHRRGEAGYDELVGGYLAQIERHLVEKGWIDKAYVYPYDEPMPQHYELVNWGFGLMKKYAPRIRRMLPVTKPPQPGLGDAANLWCIATYSLRSPLTEKRREAGDGIWWYVCNNPKAPYAADFIDRPTADLRTWLWQTWGENVKGVLIWETLQWETYRGGRGEGVLQDIWEDPMTWWGEGGVASGNGEGRLLYPSRNRCEPFRFVGSIRLEQLRDGLEDHLYFTLLGRKCPGHRLLKVPAGVYTAVDAYAADPAAMEKHRLELARELER